MTQDQKEESEDVRYYHEFTDDEIEQMMYYNDEEYTDPVKEYHYMKEEWKTPDSIVSGTQTSALPKKEKAEVSDLQKNAIDTGERTVVDLNKDAPHDEELVYLELDTEKAAQVVEFYSPWCPHCKHFKYEYIEIAREIARRTIETPVEFHAVSCGLYRPLCRAYNVDGFPFVQGWPVGSSVWDDDGIELNPPDGPRMTADSVAEALEITLAHEAKDVKRLNFSNSEDERGHEAHLIELGQEAAKVKRQWQQDHSDINERYHNAAVSLTFVLKNSVYLEEEDELNDRRAPALIDFLNLVDWASPYSWHIRTGLVDELRANRDIIIKGHKKLVEIVERHQSMHVEAGWWGGLVVQTISRRHTVVGLGGDVPAPDLDKQQNIKSNSKWSEACTHSERGMGFTCGLWDLFHILTIGSSLPDHQLYGFRSGCLTSPRDVAEVIKRFIISFFPCDVCRWNFKDMYDNCGHDHCKRLVGVMPDLLTAGGTTIGHLASDQSRRELPLWLWEVHNSVNIRLMKESAEREDRVVSNEEKLAAKFPTRSTCKKCWLSKDMEDWNQDEVLKFLSTWYWPASERSVGSRFTMERRLQLAAPSFQNSQFDYTVCLVALLVAGTIGTFVAHGTIQRQKSNYRRKNI